MAAPIADAEKMLFAAKQRLDKAGAPNPLTPDEVLIFGLSCVLAAFVAEEEARWGKAS